MTTILQQSLSSLSHIQLFSNPTCYPCPQVMMANVIQRAFDTQPCLSARGELLEGFQAMARRDFIRRFVEKKTVEFYGLFMAEINTVKKLFDAVKRSQPKSPILPRYAGLAKWVRGWIVAHWAYGWTGQVADGSTLGISMS